MAITAELCYRVTVERGLAMSTRYGEFESPELRALMERLDRARIELAACHKELKKMAGVK